MAAIVKATVSRPPRMLPDAPWLTLVREVALCSYGNLELTWRLAADCLTTGMPGDFVECGVYAGAHPVVMAHLCLLHGDQRTVHLFDSFQGIPEPGPHDTELVRRMVRTYAKLPTGKEGALTTTGAVAFSLENVKVYMSNFGVARANLVYHEGWFQDTVPGCCFPIALLRLDGDLYESIRCCLEGLYPLVVPGGYCIVDDWAFAGCQQAVREYRALIGEDPEAFERGEDSVIWWRKI